MRCFLSYARENKVRADKLYIRMRQIGLSVWMDQSPAPYPNAGIPRVRTGMHSLQRGLPRVTFSCRCSRAKQPDPDRYFHSELMAAFAGHRNGNNPGTIIPILMGADRAPVLR